MHLRILGPSMVLLVCAAVASAQIPQVTRLTNIVNAYPHPSPDGRRVVFQSNRTGAPQIHVMDADGGNVQQLTDEPEAEDQQGGQIDDCNEHEIQYQLADSSNGLKLIWELPEGVTLNIKDIIDGTLVDESFASGDGSFKVSNTDINNLKLTFCYSEVVLSQKENVTVPNKYSLLQNYPNPFNPSTKIKFGLPKESLTSLVVYNILGEQVAILLNKHLKVGHHEIEFNNFKHSSGIYFYRLQAGNFVEVKKMILLK